MTYASWEPRYRVTTIQPGKLDLFVVTLIDGRRAAVQPITEYGDALVKARAFQRDHQCQIKVLPLTGPECLNLLAINPAEAPEPVNAALRLEMVQTLEGIARDSSDTDARRDAFDMLKNMGVMKL